jgi:hypothetical protein
MKKPADSSTVTLATGVADITSGGSNRVLATFGFGDNAVYWIEDASLAVLCTPLSGGASISVVPPRAVAPSEVLSRSALTSDAESLYWYEDDGQIWTARK